MAPSPPPRLVLASASPRRRALLEGLGFRFTVIPSRMPEVPPPGPAAAQVTALALAKARAVAAGLRASGGARWVVLGADTEVVLDGRLVGKPVDAAAAGRILRALRGRTHQVITGVAVVEVPGGAEESAAVVSTVTMTDAGDAEIDAYVATGEPMDKAGAYAVQGAGGRLVAAVEGCYTNVVGLPVETTRRLLAAHGVVAG